MEKYFVAMLQPTYIYGIHRPSEVKLSANPALPPDCSPAIKKKNKKKIKNQKLSGWVGGKNIWDLPEI